MRLGGGGGGSSHRGEEGGGRSESEGREGLEEGATTSLYMNPDILIKQEVESCFELSIQSSHLEQEASSGEAVGGATSVVSDSSLPPVDSTTYLSPPPRVTSLPSPPPPQVHDQALAHHHQPQHTPAPPPTPSSAQHQHLQQQHPLPQQQSQQTPVSGTTMLPDEHFNFCKPQRTSCMIN